MKGMKLEWSGNGSMEQCRGRVCAGQWTEQTNLRPPKKGNYFTEIWIRRELLTGIYYLL